LIGVCEWENSIKFQIPRSLHVLSHHLQQIDNLSEALDALLLFADNLGDAICALRRNVGENLQAASDSLQAEKNRKIVSDKVGKHPKEEFNFVSIQS
jgi:hypothetical protein